MTTKLTVSTTINAPLEKVWDAFWNPVHIVHWAFADEATWHCPWAKGEYPKVGGIFTTRMEARDGSFWFDLTAQYTKVEELKTIEYTLGEVKEYFVDAGRVVNTVFEVVPLWDKEGIEAGGFWVKITETFDAEEVHSTEQQIAWWQSILDNFKKYVESI